LGARSSSLYENLYKFTVVALFSLCIVTIVSNRFTGIDWSLIRYSAFRRQYLKI
jgi:hypothetical protein